MIAPSSSLIDWANQIAKSALPLRPIEFGPWLGSMRSRSQDQVPREYIAAGSNFLYLPRDLSFKRRGGQTQKFDTFGSSAGLLPAKWSSKGRWLESFVSEAISDGVPTLMGLATKETVASGLDDGRFSQVYVRDQVGNFNYTLGDEFSDTTYPEPGSVPSYKVVPLWYDSGDGGITRGATEFARRFFVSGSRRFLKVGNWWYHPSLYGTPSRWRGQFTPSGGVGSAISHQYARPISVDTLGAKWTNQAGSAVNIWNVVDESTRDDADYITESIVNGAGSTLLILRLWNGGASGVTIGAATVATLRFTAKRVVVSGSPAGTEVIQVKLVSGVTTVKTITQTVTNTASFDLITTVLSAGELALINVANNLNVEISTIGQGDLHLFHDVSWVELDFSGSGTLLTNSNRLIPSGPLPTCYAGTLAKGTVISDNGVITMRPDADIIDGDWLNQAGSAVNLYQSIDETSLDTTDYIRDIFAFGAACTIGLSNPGYTPTIFDSAVMRVTWAVQGVLTDASTLTVRLMQGAVAKAQMSATALGSNTNWQSLTYTLTFSELASISDWNDLRLEFTAVNNLGTPVDIRVAQAQVDIEQTIVQNQGGWKGSDRFYYSLAFRFEDGSVWMPCMARPPSQRLLSGFNIFTVDLSNPNTTYDRVVWTNIPIGPYGCIGRILLRTPKISAVQDDNLQIDPFDLRIIWEIKDNTTTTYDDYYGTDESLTLDVAKAFIRFDHIMPPRCRYIFGGDMRVCHSYGAQSPCAIMIVPVGRTTDYDLNLPDTNPTLYNNDASYMQVSIDTAGAGQLILVQTTGAAITNTKTFLFTSSTTLQQLVDDINNTSCAVDGQQWRAALCPGANPDATTLSLTPHSRAIASCVISGQTITKTAGGLSKVAVGNQISGTGVTIGAYVSRIDSDTQLTFVGTITPATVTLTFYTELGDTPTSALANAGYQRVISHSLPGFLFFTKTYLNNEVLDKQAIWMTVASPGQAKSAANNFSGRLSNKFTPPADAGISMGGGPCEHGFVVPFSNKIGAIRTKPDSGSAFDESFELAMLNESRGCCAWNTVVPGNSFVPYLTPHGLCAANLEQEVLLSGAIFVHGADARGDFTYEIPLCVAASATDNDSAYASSRVMRGAIWTSYRSSGSHPNRQNVYDFSASDDQNGLDALINKENGKRWGWSVPLVRSVTAMAEAVRSDGSHLYGWNDENVGSTGDGRIDEIEVGDTDNGTAISGSVESPWEKASRHTQIAGVQAYLWHNAPTGSVGTFDYTRSLLIDTYSLTPSTSSSVDVMRDPKILPQGAQVGSGAFKFAYNQTSGSARTVRNVTILAQDLPTYD